MGGTSPALATRHLDWRDGGHDVERRARGPVRPRGDRPAGLAHRPLQPPLLLLHAGRGSRLVARRGGAHRRRGGPPDPGRRRAARHPRGPVHRWRAAGAARDRRHRRAGARDRPRRRDVDDHQRPGPGRDRGLARRGRACTGSTSASTRSAPTRSTRSPGATGSTTSSTGSPPPTRRASARSRSTPCCCGASTTTRRRSCCAGASTAATSSGSSSRCRWTPSTAGPATGMITADEIFERLEREFVLSPAEEPRGSAPAEKFLVDGGPATVGVIASVTRPFCGDCDRVRLTADGQVRNCLFARQESDLRAALRGRSERRGARRAVAGRDARQGRRSRDRRPDVPAARPADVSDRRLTTPARGAPRP